MKQDVNRLEVLEAITPLIENTAMRFNLVPIESIDCKEDSNNLILKFQVRSLPTLVLVDNNGEFLRKFTGHITKEVVEEIVNIELGNG